MGKIRRLPPEIINLIAAGEVVERPASVVKELVENSLDAAADHIIIRIKDGGLELIEIDDNGHGMDRQDADLAFTQHATSKLHTTQDLEQILTLGFRGEALASISSVADLELDTKPTNKTSIKDINTPATRIEITKQNKQTKDSTRAVPGTKIKINRLFSHVPARRKFLRSAQTELNHIQDVFIGLALMHLNVRFELYHNNKLLHRLPPVENIGLRIFELWPQLPPDKFYSLVTEFNKIQLRLHVGKPDIARKDRKRQFVFINRRYISDRLIQKAVIEAFHGFIHKDLQPVYFVDLQLPPNQVDVNVHPRKTEVKYQNPGSIYSLVHRSVRELLTKESKQIITNRTLPATDNLEQFQHKQPNKPKQQRISLQSTQSRNKVRDSMNFSNLLLKGTTPDKKPSMPAINLPPVLQVFNTYIVYQSPQNPDEIVFLDQHAAAEKILYEKLMRQADTAESHPLLVPELLEFDIHEKEQILKLKPKLAQVGLEVEDFGANTIQVLAKPALTPHLRTHEFIQATLDHSISYDNNPKLINQLPTPELHNLIATTACHGSIRAGQRLTEPEMHQIIGDLQQCEFPYNCPHGRPVSWTLAKYDLEKKFKRII